jgi:hypothetical protein
MEEPIKEPEQKEDELAPVKDSIEKLNEAVSGINSKLDDISTQGTPEPETEPESGWKPNTWDDIPKKAEETAESVYERKEAEKEAKAKEMEEYRKKVDKDLDDQIETLIKDKVITEEDKKSVFGLAASLGTIDLIKVGKTVSIMKETGRTFDSRTGEWIKSDYKPEGKTAPVGSSSAQSGSGGSKITYKDIHNSSMDTLIARSMNE